MTTAVESGDPAVVRRLTSIGAGKDEKLGRLALNALSRLQPTEDRSHELTRVIVKDLESAKSPRLRATLISYLGKTKDPSHRSTLEHWVTISDDDIVRIAALTALSNMGDAAREFLVAQSQDQQLPPAVRSASTYALGSARHKEAVPYLIELLSHNDLRHAAARALRTLSGKDLGKKPGRWTRWWRTQPEARGQALDPELD